MLRSKPVQEFLASDASCPWGRQSIAEILSASFLSGQMTKPLDSPAISVSFSSDGLSTMRCFLLTKISSANSTQPYFW